MQLVAFSVSNYRSITTAYKLPIRRATILIGPNNEGKSNVLRALVLALEVLSTLGGRRITGNRLRAFQLETRATYSWPHDFPMSLQEKMPAGESTFNVEFKLTAEEIEEFYEEVKSTLNGTLPIRLTLGPKAPGFWITKKGPGASALSKKAEAIANFVAKRININHIPAVRTAEAATDVVSGMVERELAAWKTIPLTRMRWPKWRSFSSPYGRGVSTARWQTRPRCCYQDIATRVCAGSGSALKTASRSTHPGISQPPQHRGDLRPGRARRSALHTDLSGNRSGIVRDHRSGALRSRQ